MAIQMNRTSFISNLLYLPICDSRFLLQAPSHTTGALAWRARVLLACSLRARWHGHRHCTPPRLDLSATL